MRLKSVLISLMKAADGDCFHVTIIGCRQKETFILLMKSNQGKTTNVIYQVDINTDLLSPIIEKNMTDWFSKKTSTI